MKKAKIRMSKALAGIMAVMCFVGNCAPLHSYALEETKTVMCSETDNRDSITKYVALGDSITAGNSTYVSKVSDYLGDTYGNCATQNLAVDGWRSDDLLDALTNPANSRYNSMRKAISNADVITLDIGSNDVFATAVEVISKCFGCTPDQLGAVTADWSKRIQNANPFTIFVLYMQAMGIAHSINYQLNYGDAIPDAIAGFEMNYKSILAEIKQLAPNAKVYIGNLYNPYVKAAPVYVGSYQIVDMEVFARTNILKMNKIIADNAKDNTVVDLYNTINNPKYIKGDVVNYDYDPHPNQAGQTAIAAKFIDAIKTGK